MNDQRFSRLIPVIGQDNFELLQSKHVAVFGLGGVGGIVCEVLARSGVGQLTFIDGDDFEESNINRQIGALTSTIGCPKAEIMAKRALEINPNAKVNALKLFYDGDLDLAPFDYIADCIDSVPQKTALIVSACRAGIPIVSAMGAGNKRDPSRFKIADIYSTKVCPLARVMRSRLRKEGITELSVAYSDEEPSDSDTLGSFMTATAACGLVLAQKVLSDLLKKEI